MTNLTNKIGDVFGSLTIIGFAEPTGKNKGIIPLTNPK